MYLVLVQILQTVEKITYDSRNLSLSLSLSFFLSLCRWSMAGQDNKAR